MHADKRAKAGRGPICCRQNAHDTWSGQCVRCVDGKDAGMGMSAAHKANVQHAGKFDVIDEIAAAAKEALVFWTQQWLSDKHCLCPRYGRGGQFFFIFQNMPQNKCEPIKNNCQA
jgi:hypothetical protein